MTPINATTGASVVTAVAPGRTDARQLVPGPAKPVRVLAHRGLSGHHRPENTVAAVAAALMLGADGVEVDVRLTADGVLVCSHDHVLVGSDGREVVIADADARQVRSLDLGGGHRPATLEEVLAVVALHGGAVVVEAKAVETPGYAERLGRQLARALAHHPAGVTVSSFDAGLLSTLRPTARSSGARTALLGNPATPLTSLLRRALDDGHDEVHPNVRAVLDGPAAVACAHRLGVAVTPWTVNRRTELRRVADLGVAALITDHPARARDALAGQEHRVIPGDRPA